MKKLAVAVVVAAAAAAIVLALSGGASGSHTVVGDHYLCYLAADTATTPQNPPPVNLQDQFGTEEQADPLPADRLCTPTGKDGATVRDPQTHLKRYRIRNPAPITRTVRVDNQFGVFTFTVGPPEYLLVPTTKNTGQQPNPATPEFEHYKCYTFRKAPQVRDQFGQGTLPVLNWILCNPARKIHAGRTFNIKRRARHLLCFPVAGPFERQVLAVNQFGQEQLRLSARREFCVPSTKQVITPPPPPTG